jgi:hypothetical protein
MIRKETLNIMDSAQQCKAQNVLTNQRTGVNVVNSSQTPDPTRILKNLRTAQWGVKLCITFINGPILV